jgi:hypothetical protein
MHFNASYLGCDVDIKESISIIISVFSACTAIISVIMARMAINNQRHMQGLLANHDLLSRTTNLLMQDHNLLRILGVDPKDLHENGITPEEFIFVNASMDAGHAMYRLTGKMKPEITDFRKHFLRDNKVRKIWKSYLRCKIFNKSPWTEAVDKYISEYEAEQSSVTSPN